MLNRNRLILTNGFTLCALKWSTKTANKDKNKKKKRKKE